MDSVIYVSREGADQALLAMGIHANNLANLNTVGFRADYANMIAENVEGNGLDSRVLVVAEDSGTDFSPGALITTGRDLDVAIADEGFIAVQAPDGTEGYTRNGQLEVDATGLLTTKNGLLVMGDGGPIAIPSAASISIGNDGTIGVQVLGQDATNLVNVGRIKLVNPNLTDIRKDNNGLFKLKPGVDELGADNTVKLVSGALESSNVNAVSEMVEMISVSREYEMQVKILETAEKDDQTASEIISIS